MSHSDQNDKSYLQDLLLHIKKAQQDQKSLPFRVVYPKGRGLVVKVGGLFAYVSFKHFAWTYPDMEYWESVADCLVGCRFYGKIHQVAEDPISILIDAKEQHFRKPELEKYTSYQAVILQKAKYGFFVDLGVHFQWRFGSIMALIHKSMLDKADWQEWEKGDKVQVPFQGINERGQLILGGHRQKAAWMRGDLDAWVGTVQEVQVVVDENGEKNFYVQGKYKAKIPVRKDLYPHFKYQVKDFIDSLDHGATIDGEILKINKANTYFTLKLLFAPENL